MEFFCKCLLNSKNDHHLFLGAAESIFAYFKLDSILRRTDSCIMLDAHGNFLPYFTVICSFKLCLKVATKSTNSVRASFKLIWIQVFGFTSCEILWGRFSSAGTRILLSLTTFLPPVLFFFSSFFFIFFLLSLFLLLHSFSFSSSFFFLFLSLLSALG